MSKIVRVVDSIVREIIPSGITTLEDVAKWYNPDFAAECIAAPDGVEQNWTYGAATNTFAAPIVPKPTTSAPTPQEQLRADIDYLAALQGVSL